MSRNPSPIGPCLPQGGMKWRAVGAEPEAGR
jgi:hypothetical protein